MWFVLSALLFLISSLSASEVLSIDTVTQAIGTGKVFSDAQLFNSVSNHMSMLTVQDRNEIAQLLRGYRASSENQLAHMQESKYYLEKIIGAIAFTECLYGIYAWFDRRIDGQVVRINELSLEREFYWSRPNLNGFLVSGFIFLGMWGGSIYFLVEELKKLELSIVQCNKLLEIIEE